jgi:hypothetical protein
MMNMIDGDVSDVFSRIRLPLLVYVHCPALPLVLSKRRVITELTFHVVGLGASLVTALSLYYL